jgi:hypothetical protein
MQTCALHHSASAVTAQRRFSFERCLDIVRSFGSGGGPRCDLCTQGCAQSRRRRTRRGRHQGAQQQHRSGGHGISGSLPTVGASALLSSTPHRLARSLARLRRPRPRSTKESILHHLVLRPGGGCQAVSPASAGVPCSFDVSKLAAGCCRPSLPCPRHSSACRTRNCSGRDSRALSTSC